MKGLTLGCCLQASNAPPGAKYRRLDEVPWDSVEAAQLIKELNEHPHVLKELRGVNPDLATAIETNDIVKYRTIWMKIKLQVRACVGLAVRMEYERAHEYQRCRWLC